MLPKPLLHLCDGAAAKAGGHKAPCRGLEQARLLDKGASGQSAQIREAGRAAGGAWICPLRRAGGLCALCAACSAGSAHCQPAGGGRFLFARYGGLSKRFLLFIINSIVSREARRADFLAARPGRYQRMKRRAQQDGRPLEGRQALLAQTRRHRALLRRNAGHRGAVGGLKNATGTPRDMPWTPPRRARWGEGRTAQRERSTGDPAQRRWGA